MATNYSKRFLFGFLTKTGLSSETGMGRRSCVVDGEEKNLLKQECFQK